MILDTSAFPHVQLSERHPEHDWEPQLDALLAREERFVLITSPDPLEDPGETPGDRKRRAQWFKRNKSTLRRWCAGAILIEHNRARALTVQVMAKTMGKVFGFPIRVADNPTDARERAARLLDEH